METIYQKCVENNMVESFCNCIADEEILEPTVEAFCNRAKTDKDIAGREVQELADLKMSLMDLEEEACCDC